MLLRFAWNSKRSAPRRFITRRLLTTVVGAAIAVSATVMLSSCGSSNSTTLPATAVSPFAGTYTGTWSFVPTSASVAYGGPVVLVVNKAGVVTVTFDDQKTPQGTGTFMSTGTVDASGNITMTPSGLIGAPSFSGTFVSHGGSFTASGTVSYDYPGAGSWTSTSSASTTTNQ